MDTLRDWYRYVDQMSRPSRRVTGDEGGSAQAAWRPWMPPASPDEAEDAVRPEAIPDLAPSLRAVRLTEARQQASPEFQDPTLYDELAPAPQFTVPDLTAPRFQLTAPSLLKPGAPVEEPAPALFEAPRLDLPGPVTGKAPARQQAPAAPPAAAADEAEGEGEGDGEGRRRTRQSRDELVQRLSDPTLTLEQTATILGVCPTTVRRYTNKGLLAHFRTQGNQRRFRFSDVREFQERQKGSPELQADMRKTGG